MKKRLIAAFISLSSISILPSSSLAGVCVDNILTGIELNPTFSADQVQCITSNASFAKVITSLCDGDQSGVSPMFAAYLEFKGQHDTLATQLKNEPAESVNAAILSARLISVDRSWSLLGHRDEVYLLMSPVKQACGL